MLKLVVTDLDGTLFHDDHSFSKQAEDFLNQLPMYGIEYIPASGRGAKGGMTFLDKLHYKTDIIGLNGAIFFNKDRECQFLIPIQIDDIKKVQQVFVKYNLIPMISTLENWYAIGNPNTRFENIQEIYKVHTFRNTMDFDHFI